jgi:hypothetical protein
MWNFCVEKFIKQTPRNRIKRGGGESIRMGLNEMAYNDRVG